MSKDRDAQLTFRLPQADADYLRESAAEETEAARLAGDPKAKVTIADYLNDIILRDKTRRRVARSVARRRA